VTRLAAVLPGVTALRDVTSGQLAAHAGLLPDPLLERVRHVVGEIERTAAAAAALERGNLAAFGGLMYESHRSLRDDYEVSVPELDTLVQACAATPGVLGARMTGGGFGGCVVALVDKAHVEAAAAAVAKAFALRFGRAPAWFVTGAADGAGEIAA
jgi:galactokinase